MPTKGSRETTRSPRRAIRAAAARRPAAAPSSRRRTDGAATRAGANRATAVRFRRARPGDVAAILRMMRGLYRQDVLRYRRAVAHRALVGLMRAPRFGRVFVIDAGGALAGYFVLTLSWSLEYTGGDAFVDE